MRAIFALSCAQLLLLVVTRSRELSREFHVTKHKTQTRSNFPLSNFENSGTIQFNSSSSTSRIRGLCPKKFEKRAHPNIHLIKTSSTKKTTPVYIYSLIHEVYVIVLWHPIRIKVKSHLVLEIFTLIILIG